MPDLWTEGGAQCSPCLTYRWSLDRVWDRARPQLAWVMLNPSTADGREDDPTIRKCIGFSRRWGFGSLVVVNLFAYRATDPRDLVQASRGFQEAWLHVVGEKNDTVTRETCRKAAAVVVAWGAQPIAEARAAELLESDLLPDRLLCIGHTAAGAPRHPLMAAYTDQPEVFRGSAGDRS